MPLQRPIVTCGEYLQIAREILAGTPHPFYGADVADVLSDAGLAHYNETHDLQARLDSERYHAAATVQLRSTLWRLVEDAGTRKTVSLAAVREALNAPAPNH